jgi:hypothetical protein
MAAVYWPPRKTPLPARRTMSPTIEARPTVAAPGSAAMSRVTTPEPTIASSVARLRPVVSASIPNTAAPTGRVIRVDANTAALSSAVVPAEKPAGWKYAVAGARTSTGR